MQSFILALSVFLAVVPLVGYLAVIWWMDRYEREPLWLTGLTFLWGASVGAFGALVVADALGDGLRAALGPGGADLAKAVATVAIAPVVEEATKGLVLLLLLSTRHFDNATDGVLYGAATGLGFAMTENFFYFAAVYANGGVGAWVVNVVIRTLFSALTHACASGAFGFALGVGRYRRSAFLRRALVPAGYVSAVAIHAFWNGSLTFAQGGKDVSWMAAAFLGLPAIVVCLLALTQGSLYLEHRLLRRELEEEERLGHLPAGHAAILPFVLRRRRRGWLTPGIDRDAYVRVATRLAFRKSQVRVRSGAEADALLQEVAELRREVVRLLLGPAAVARPAVVAGAPAGPGTIAPGPGA